MVLLVVDIQKGVVGPAMHRYDLFLPIVSRLIETARAGGTEVIFVRHSDGEDSILHKGLPGYEICPEVAPLPGERIFDKTVNSPFRDTGLTEYLRCKGERQIIAVGASTEFCMDATVKCGFEHGFEMIIPTEANTTGGSEYMTGEDCHRFYNEFMWPRRYAACVSAEDALDLLGQKRVKPV